MSPADLFDLSGRRALVTGGGTGIGRELARGLAAVGAEVLLVGRRREPLERVAADLGARVWPCDVTDAGERARLCSEAGDVDILVNNAGTSDHRHWASVREEDWRRVLSLNLDAAFQLAQCFGPGMVERGWGRIVNVASIYGTIAPDPDRYPGRPVVQAPAYGASKAGLIGLTRHLAAILAADGVTVNTLSPGMFVTEGTEDLVSPEVRAELVGRTPARRMGRAEDVHGAIAFLASDAAAFVTGIDLVVDGGYSLW